jgi:hypothetical protein
MLDALRLIQAAMYMASNNTSLFNKTLSIKPSSYRFLRCMLNEKQEVSCTIALLGKYQFLQLTYNEEYLYLVASVSTKLPSCAIQPDSGLNPPPL